MRGSHRVLSGALIGCGYFGQIQLEAWRRMPDVEIVAACDLELSKAQASAPKAYTSIENLLGRSNSISWISRHAPIRIFRWFAQPLSVGFQRSVKSRWRQRLKMPSRWPSSYRKRELA